MLGSQWSRERLLVVFSAALAAGCGSSREGGPPRLARAHRLDARAEELTVGSRGTIYYTLSSYAARGRGKAIYVVDPGGTSSQAIKLDYSVTVKALAADGRGSLYVGLRDAGKDQVWIYPEEASGEKVEPKAKLKPELPGDLNSLVTGREPGILYVLCGDNRVVKLKSDGSIAAKIELPGDSPPRGAGVDQEGNLYVRRSSGPLVKVLPDGKIDQAWARSEAATIDYVSSLAVDSRGIVYMAASEGGIYLRGYHADGTLAFNVVAEPLDSTPDRLVVGATDRLYVLDGHTVYEFRP